jgi:hypothetical protein
MVVIYYCKDNLLNPDKNDILPKIWLEKIQADRSEIPIS